MSKTAKSSTPPSGRKGKAHDITVSVTDGDGDVVSQTVHLETVGMQVGGVHSDTITGGSGADIIIGDKGHIDGVQNTGIYNLSLVSTCPIRCTPCLTTAIHVSPPLWKR